MCFLTFPINLAASSNVPLSYQSPRLPHFKTNVSSASLKIPRRNKWLGGTWFISNMCKVSVFTYLYFTYFWTMANSMKCPLSTVHSKVKSSTNDIWMIFESNSCWLLMCLSAEDKGPLSTYQTRSEEARKATVFVFLLGRLLQLLQRVWNCVSSERSSLCYCHYATAASPTLFLSLTILSLLSYLLHWNMHVGPEWGRLPTSNLKGCYAQTHSLEPPF